jgi:hypothetical protein
VTGTAFRLAWDPTRERFELEMWSGSVKLSGPKLSPDCVVASGGRVVVTPKGDAASSGACAASEFRAQPAAAIESSAPLPLSSSEEGTAVLGPLSTKQRATLRELSRLADQARFSGKPERAVEALLELRSRFSSRPQCWIAKCGRVSSKLLDEPRHGTSSCTPAERTKRSHAMCETRREPRGTGCVASARALDRTRARSDRRLS